MAAQAAARGKKALEDRKYEDAVVDFTAAIKESPTSPDYFIQRSIAHQRAGNHHEALADAEQAVLNGQQRAKREAIIEAQFRRGVALYKLQRFGDAQFILNRVMTMDSKHKQAKMWIDKTAMDLKNIPTDDERTICTISETPAPPKLTDSTNGGEEAANLTTLETASTETPAGPPQTPAGKIRYDWYQNSENIYFTLLAKGVPKDKAHVEVAERSLSISFPLATGSSYDLTLEPLFAAIIPNKCITRIMASKVEIILIKASPGQKWSALESNDPVSTKTDDANGDENDAIKTAVLQESGSKVVSDTKPIGPVYPTSSKSGPKDWDKIAKESRLSEGKPDSQEDDDDFEGGDPADSFFKRLYKKSDPDTQRAIMKSYTESNGTALSTNWQEVSKGPVPTEPPSGMEAKKWSQ